jgi:fructose-1,6-bisphosphatase/inositol monophosphatase family enzyme
MTDRPQQFVEVVSPAIRQAAAIARALEGQVANEPKDEESAVKSALTIADTASQEALLVPLLEHFPDVALSAEEDTPTAALFPTESESRVVIDPIDGTLHSYLEGRGPYATMVGLAVRGRFEAALVALPREGIFLDGVRGGEVRRARPRANPKPWRAENRGRRVLVHHEMPKSVCSALETSGYEVAFGCGGAIAVSPLLKGFCGGLRLAKDTISIRGRVGLLIAKEAGAHITTETGAPFPDDLETPARGLALAADPTDLEALQSALRQAF